MKQTIFVLHGASEDLLFKIRPAVLKSDSTSTLPAFTQRFTLAIADSLPVPEDVY